MPSRRMIDPEFWQSETVAELTYRQRLLFIGLFSNADDQGRLRGNPSLIRSTVFPYDDISLDEIEADIKTIEATGSIYTYVANGKECIQVTGWWKYQSPQWAYPSKIPPPTGWADKLRYRKDNQVLTENWTTPVQEFLPKPLPKDLPNDLGGSTVLALALALALEKDLASEPAEEPVTEGESEGALAANAAGEVQLSTSGKKSGEARKPSEKEQKRAELENYFLEVSGLPAPRADTQSRAKETNKLWWSHERELLGWVDWDLNKAFILVKEAVSAMREKGLVIGTFKSIMKTAGNEFGERNGRSSSGSVIDEYRKQGYAYVGESDKQGWSHG